MGENSKIEWTHHTFNPWLGCTKVSPACANCYAEAWAKRTGIVKWGDNAARRRTSDTNWRQPLMWDREAATAGERRRVFCASLADVFEDRPELEDWRLDLFALINDTPNLDWLLLTKRPENIFRLWCKWYAVPSNVSLGTTVESNDYRKRVDDLIENAGQLGCVLFLSCEPLLGPLDLRANQRYQVEHGGYRPLIDDLDWVIAGGESGGHARPSHPDWFRNLRDQCVAAKVPFHFKQWGEFVAAEQNGCSHISSDGAQGPVAKLAPSRVDVWRCNVCSRLHGESNDQPFDFAKTGKKAAGRLLDGVEWNQFPSVRNEQESRTTAGTL